MRNIEKKLINLLIQEQPTTANYLSDKLNVSVRSIKNYVKAINSEYPNVILSSNKGYSINMSNIEILSKPLTHPIPNTSDERVKYLINILISSDQGKFDLYELCENLYISETTLKRDFIKVKRLAAKFDLDFVVEGDYISLSGLEKNKRKLISSMLYHESMNSFIDIDTIQNAFPDIIITSIQEIINTCSTNHCVYINDYSLLNLILHISITIDRISAGYTTPDESHSMQTIPSKDLLFINDVITRIEKAFKIKFSNSEAFEMYILISSRTINANLQIITKNNLENYIGENCMRLVNILTDEMLNIYGINLTDQEFLVRFSLHIHNLLIRYENNYLSKNPLTEKVKTSCPLIYDISVNLAGIIKKETGAVINDDEIAYIAFHLGGAIEAQQKLTEKIKTVIWCPNYYDINSKIVETLNKHFPDDLIITSVVQTQEELKTIDNVDLILSTISLSMPSTLPFLEINLFPTKKDLSTIKCKLSEIQLEKKRLNFKKNLKGLFREELFEISDKTFDRDSCIKHLCQKLFVNGYVDATFEESIFEREKISSTVLGEFAIPHAMKLNANKTGIYVLISNNDITWTDKNIHLVIMLAFSKKERSLFNELFETIIPVLSNKSALKDIIRSKNYNEFINNIVLNIE